ncbi:MAG: hypothetical protein Q8P41_32340 [Pseudomonadota bacterium]|nr:hypothetical protein [Pseudomonadota bacterium]
MILLALLACAPAPREGTVRPGTHARAWTPVADQDARLVPLPVPRLLRRMSLDLRGTLPTAAELDAVEADATALDGLRDAYVADARFEGRLVELLAERWLTTVDEFLIEYREFPAIGLDPTNEYPFERAVGEEPLRLMARVAAEDRPWTDIVTADTTMANEVLGQTWPVDYPTGETGWQEVSYTDGRPAAGVLATNGLWWRYYTTFSNYNRMRVSALAKLLLCVDYLSRPVTFSGSVSLAPPATDADGTAEALRTNPYCQGCHASLDPVAAGLFGFWTPQEYSGVENVTYHPERELLGESLLGVEAAWYGAPLAGLADLGQHVAADPRFARCTAQSVAEMYWRREVTVDDFDRVEQLRLAYVDGGARFKDVVVAATDSAAYRAGGLTEAAATASGVADGGTDENTARMMDVTLLASVLDDLAGFDWTWNGYDQLRNDTWGYRILGGGVDGTYVSRAQRLPGLTWTIVLARVAEAAGVAIATHDLGEGADTPWLLDRVIAADDSTTAAFSAQVGAARWRLLAERPTDTDLTEDAALFAAVVADTGDTSTAWAALISAWLRDPTFGSY